MKEVLRKICVPTLIIGIAVYQSFGIDFSRSNALLGFQDSSLVKTNADTLITPDSLTTIDSLNIQDTLTLSSIDSNLLDTLKVIDSLDLDRSAIEKVISAKDTIVVPDSLKDVDPFKYKYYLAIKDTVYLYQVKDSLLQAGDTLEFAKLDSLYKKDSIEVALEKHRIMYASLSRKERKKYDYEQALPAKIAKMDSILNRKDSIRAYKDSVRASIPRVLTTFAIPDSMQYKRIILWTHDRDFHNVNLQKYDTTYNNYFYDYPFMKKDVDASYLGVAGSPVQTYNFFKREKEDGAIFYTPYMAYNYTPESLPMYNTKTPYTELAYWGTLFSNREKEESNIRIFTTQNITPGLNFTLEYDRFGGNGMLRRENVDNRTFIVGTNFLGKKYMMHAGFIRNRIKKSENGGIIDNMWIRDTTVDAREIAVYLTDANSVIKKNTLFLDQIYRIPLTASPEKKYNKELKKQKKIREERRDSIMASGDSVAIEAYLQGEAIELQKEQEKPEILDTLNKDATTAFIGHSSDYSVYTKSYTDNIGSSDAAGRGFYGDRFYINPAKSADSLRTMKLENKFFIRLQPWKSDAILSKIDVGIGNKLMTYYAFNYNSFVTKTKNVLLNSTYAYAGIEGQFRKYLQWDASGKYNFIGYEVNDFGVEGNIRFNAYPFRRQKQSPLTLEGHFETSLKEPDYYEQHLLTNHFKWNNNFKKTSTTKIQAKLDIPYWKLDASFSYALLSNNIYFDTQGMPQQNERPMSIMTASLNKNFKLWKFGLDHQALFQLSSNPEVLPLPMLALNFRYYFEFNVVKKVMEMQIGANATYTTKWYAPAYNPVLGVFHNQNIEKYGNSPYIDLFVNVQWKNVCLFLKVINVNQGWPNKSKDYFGAHNYIKSQRAFKLGIWWPFYVYPKKAKKLGISGGSGMSSGGGGMMQNLGGFGEGMGGGRGDGGFGGGMNRGLGGGGMTDTRTRY